MATDQESRKNIVFSIEKALKEGSHCSLLGGLGVGKTRLAKTILGKSEASFIPLFVDLERMSLTPEGFASEFIALASWAFLKKEAHERASFSSMSTIASHEKELGRDAISIASGVENELLKIKPNQELLVKESFRFLHSISNKSGKKILVAFDSFGLFLELNNYDQIKDAVSLMGLENQAVRFLLISSSVSEMKNELPALKHFAVGDLDRKDAEALVREIWASADKKTIDELLTLTSHPLALKMLARDCKESGKKPKEAFYAQLLCKEAGLFRHCASSLSHYLSRARGQTLPKAILKTISQGEFRLSEIARKIYRSAPVTKSLIDRLVAVDIIEKKGKVFVFCDPLLGLWMKLVSLGFEFDSAPTQKEVEEVMRRI